MSKKTILITGSVKRIGKVIAQHFFEKGWNIAFHYNNSQEEVSKIMKEFKSSDQRIAFFKANLMQKRSYKNLIKDVLDCFGNLDCLVNNAAIFRQDNLLTCTKKSWDEHMEVNLRAPLFLTQEYAKLVGTGNVVNIIDECVLNIRKNFFSYGVSKNALWHLTKVLALSLAPNFRVNAIGPGTILSSTYQSEGELQEAIGKLPLRRKIDPKEIAEAIYFLIMHQPSVTGQMLALDAGEHLAKGCRK